MAMDFPASPVDGQVFNGNGRSWVYVAATGTWDSPSATSPALSTFAGIVVESVNIVSTGFAGFTYYATTNNSVQYITANSTANGTLNMTAASGATINSVLGVGKSTTLVLAITNGATAYYPTTIQVDGATVTPKWSGGTAPTAGNANAVDVYTFTIIKTAATPTYTVLASQTKFA